MVKYSFVLPAYKAHFFKEAIDSILSQTYKDFELIIVNDASPEDLDSIVKQYDDLRIRYYVNKENLGGKDLVAQWNHCLEYAKGEYVILASDDDVYHPQYLEKMDELVCKYPDVNVFRPRVQYIDCAGTLFATEGFLKEIITKLEFIHSWVNGWISSGIPFYLFKKTALFQIGGFVSLPLAWFSDDATVIKLLDKGMAYSSEVLFYFRMSGESITTKLHSKVILLKKIEATEMFCDMIKQELASVSCLTNEDKFLLANISELYLPTIYRNKIVTQIFNAPFKVVIGVFPRMYKMNIVPKKQLIDRYFKYLVRRLLFWN